MVAVSLVSSLFVVDGTSVLGFDAELDAPVCAPEPLAEVAEAITPAMVELAAASTDEVCGASACVALAVPVLILVSIAERLNVIPNSALPVVVLLSRPGKPVVVAKDGRIDDVHVEFAPETSGLDDLRGSLAGTCWLKVFESVVDDCALVVLTLVSFTAKPVTELNRENATVLRSSTLVRTLEI